MPPLSLLAVLALAAPPPPDFDKQVAPLLVRHCAGCHSGKEPKGDLDITRQAAVAPLAADLWKKVEAGEMPPKKVLPEGDKKVLKAWIDGGAKWGTDPIRTTVTAGDWWAFQPLKANPDRKGGGVPANQIDHFINAKLKEKGLTPSPEADRRTLIRRLYFDLIGLPPTPEQVASFVADDSPTAYEKLVDALLASPQYGERWARHWLDVVHYGETHGYDKDKPRLNAWPYRDYVIRSLNADKPYPRFVQEQIAGDVLFPGTPDGVEALGFLAAGPWDFIGHAELPESKIDGKVARHLDRDDFVANTMSTFLSLTAHCAQCHDHKFDPIGQKEYYALQAVFAAIDRTDRTYDADPKTAGQRTALTTRKAGIAAKLAALDAATRKDGGAKLAEAEAAVVAARDPKKPVPPEFGYHSAVAKRQTDAKWVQVDLGKATKVERVLLRPCHDDFNGIGSGFGFPVRFKVELADDAEFKTPTPFADHTAADFPNPGTAAVVLTGTGTGRYVRLTATKLAPRQSTDFILAVAEVEAFDAAGRNVARGAEVQALDSIQSPARWQKANLTDGIHPANPFTAADLGERKATRDRQYEAALGDERRKDRAAARTDLADVEGQLAVLPKTERTAYIGAVHTGSGHFVGTGEKGGKPRPIHLLPRGDVTKPGEAVGPGALAAIPVKFELPPNATEGDRRAALAKWLTHPDNPPLWRSIANRVWQYHFGRGLVDTPNDFGRMGQTPTHPELLDLLAVELRDSGGSLKGLHKRILLSATYRQSSAPNAENDKADSDNRYLWRQNRRKLEAEVVRDSILFVAGKLNPKMGGPSFQDFVIDKPEHSPHYLYDRHDPDDARAHRRSVYRFVVRSQQQPFLAALDCADPSLAVDKRNETITPQQALTLLNNKLTVAMAKHFAARVEKLAADDAGRVSAAFKLAVGRDPTATEAEVLAKHATAHGLASACRLILNLNEFAFAD